VLNCAIQAVPSHIDIPQELQPMTESTKITIMKNGPFRVTGTVELVDHEGKAIETPPAGFALCRCGASTRKPFCDGTHSKIGFDASAQVVPESKE
jgi:CDGSH-type Zn-finger protein